MQQFRLEPQSEIVFTDFEGGEGILVDLNSKQYYRLNETAALIWRGLEQRRNPEEIVEELLAAYDVTREHASGSIANLVAKFEAHHLLKRVAN